MSEQINIATVLGYPIALGDIHTLVDDVFAQSQTQRQQHIVTLNPEMIMVGEAHPAFGDILKHADMPIPDGAGVVWALGRQGIAQGRIPGIEFAQALLDHLNTTHDARGVALVGAAPEVMAKLPVALMDRYPDLTICFTRDGFFPPDEEHPIAEAMAAMHPKVVMVALGVPRQETWIATHRRLFAEDTIFIGVGGSFNVWTDSVKRAPLIMQRLNLEWAWRLALEPWRIKRSMPPLLRFVARVLRIVD
jgi:N-acetylglucosaminyldiphosphoundecaprenol N-acetyl-beta-D-mannosaminyltransferase